MDGILNIYKEKGFTSHDVVAKLRGILKMKKIGHTGTLDPNAVGVLPVCLGKATKVCDLLTDKKKTYEAVLKLGVETDTQDMTGTILIEAEVLADEETIRETVLSFLGAYAQIPPMYSALKVNGRKLYELAREGKVIERRPREVFLYQIEIHSIDMEKKEVCMSVECSKGTYIRTLCHDIGQKLGCGGAMSELKRTKVDCFEVSESLTLEQVEKLVKEGKIEEYVKKPDSLFTHLRSVSVLPEYQKYVDNGNKLLNKQLSESIKFNKAEQVRVYDAANRFIGIFEHEGAGNLKPVKLFFI